MLVCRSCLQQFLLAAAACLSCELAGGNHMPCCAVIAYPEPKQALCVTKEGCKELCQCMVFCC